MSSAPGGVSAVRMSSFSINKLTSSIRLGITISNKSFLSTVLQVLSLYQS